MQNIVLGRDLLPRDFRPHSMQILINYIRLRLIQSQSHSPAFTGTTWGLCQKRSAHTGVCHVDIITAVVWSNVKFPLANRSRSLNIYLMGSFDVMLVRGKKLFRSHSPIKFHIAILRIPACFPFFGVLFPRNRLRWQNISENLGIVKITKLIHWTFFFGGFLLLSLAVKGIISSFHCRFLAPLGFRLTDTRKLFISKAISDCIWYVYVSCTQHTHINTQHQWIWRTVKSEVYNN